MNDGIALHPLSMIFIRDFICHLLKYGMFTVITFSMSEGETSHFDNSFYPTF